MPYVSDAQRRFFHSPGAAKAGLSTADVAKWDEESKGQANLPERAPKAKRRGKQGTKVKPRARSMKAGKVGRAGKVKRA